MNKDRYSLASTLYKGLKIFELIVEKKTTTVTAVASELGIQKSAAHRYLSTLKILGYVTQNDRSQYLLTDKLSLMAKGKVPKPDVVAMVKPFLEKISELSRETVNFAQWNGKEIILLDIILSKEMLQVNLNVGSRVPAYCNALGKVILAFIPKNELRMYIKTVRFEPWTPHTITDQKKLTHELIEVRKKGFALQHEEIVIGLNGIAVPIFNKYDYPEYCLSISGPIFRLTDDKIDSFKKPLINIGKNISDMIQNRL